jgi:hypothetical protein
MILSSLRLVAGNEFDVPTLGGAFDEISESCIRDIIVASLCIEASLRPSATDILAEFVQDSVPERMDRAQ